MIVKSVNEWMDAGEVGAFNGGIVARGGTSGLDTIETEYGSQEHGYYPPDEVSKAKVYYMGNTEDDFNEDRDPKTVYGRRFARKQELSKKYGRKNFNYVTQEFALANKPEDIKDEEVWKNAVKSTFYINGQYELKDVVTMYNKLIKTKMDIYAKYGKKNENFNSDKLYHSTSIENAVNILKIGEIKTYENILKAANQNPKDWYDDPNYGKYVYVSDFIHDENNYYGLSDLDVTFVIDSKKLKSKIHQPDKNHEGGTILVKGNIPLSSIEKVILHKENRALIELLSEKNIEYEIKK